MNESDDHHQPHPEDPGCAPAATLRLVRDRRLDDPARYFGRVPDAEMPPPPPGSDNLAVGLMADRLRSKLFGEEQVARRVGQYALVKQLGEGGQGTVWAAYDEKLDRRVAVKLLQPELNQERAEARLLKEARALAKISHPNVVQVHEADEHEGGVYVVMEFIKGRTVDVWILEDDPSWETILDVYQQVAKGLTAAHEAGLVHRDVKPQNILVNEDGDAKLVDFGLVKRDPKKTQTSEATSSMEQRLRQSTASNLTEQGTVLGTPFFLAPEQLRKGEATAQSDQFSFSVAIFYGLFRQLPFEGNTPIERTVAIAEGKLREPEDFRGVPKAVYHVITKGLRPEPGNRYEGMRAMVDALKRARSGGGSEPAIIEAVPPKGGGVPVPIVITIVVVLVAGLAAALFM
jgi:serine/threonine protein kinase